MTEQYCDDCGHPKSQHEDTGVCFGQVMAPAAVPCRCKEFKPHKREDFSQAAARIVKEATEGK